MAKSRKLTPDAGEIVELGKTAVRKWLQIEDIEWNRSFSHYGLTSPQVQELAEHVKDTLGAQKISIDLPPLVNPHESIRKFISALPGEPTTGSSGPADITALPGQSSIAASESVEVSALPGEPITGSSRPAKDD